MSSSENPPTLLADTFIEIEQVGTAFTLPDDRPVNSEIRINSPIPNKISYAFTARNGSMDGGDSQHQLCLDNHYIPVPLDAHILTFRFFMKPFTIILAAGKKKDAHHQ